MRLDGSKQVPGRQSLPVRVLRARHESAQLARLLGLWTPEESHAYHRYWRLACEWRDAHMSGLAATVGGGTIGAGVAAIVASAAMQLGASRYLADLGAQTGSPKLLSEASKLANDSRQNLLAAHELAAKEAKSRPVRSEDEPWLIPVTTKNGQPTPTPPDSNSRPDSSHPSPITTGEVPQ